MVCLERKWCVLREKMVCVTRENGVCFEIKWCVLGEENGVC